MTPKEGRICSNFRQAKDKRLQIEIDADVYCSGEETEVLNILSKFGYEVEEYRIKPTDPQYRGRPKMYDENTMSELYKEGNSDIEIAEIMGTCRQLIYGWRIKNGLPANGRKKRSPNKKSRTVGAVTA